MKDPTSVIWRCTIQKRSGAFCDMPGMVDMPFPICRAHAERIYEGVAEHRGESAEFLRGALAKPQSQAEAEYLEFARRRDEAAQRQSQVYYVRLGDHIKIGYTTNMTQRLVALRADPDVVLATEPGGRDLEQQRHREFASDRIGRREDFNPSRRLIAHIAEVRAQHGLPTITSWPTAAAG